MSPINLDIKDKIAVATMDYPPVNALSSEANNEIIELFDSFHTNKDVNVVVLTAVGSRAFCAGVDLNSRLPSGNSQNDPSAHYRRARETFNSIYECAVPVIGAINGPALGAGLAIAASCDFLIASDNANFGLPEIDVGLLGGAGHLQRLFPQNVTRMMNFTAKRMPAEAAKSYGAVIEVTTLDNLLPTALEYAEVIAKKMSIGLRMAKATLNQIEWMDLKNAYKFEQTQTEILQSSDEAIAAKKAFLDNSNKK
tara:strand:- start:3886 stop:4644 length:759 start_codon:yes stop_codon:yes gene_type:complete